jgi:pyruvate dehydrogenase E2 component (dihydrolipoamide acetyltransferase)
MRHAIAAAMARSKREIPHYYLGAAIDLSRSLAWLAKSNGAKPPAERLLLAVLFLKAVAVALGKTPELNGFYVDGAFQQAERVHVGMAIAMRGGGLVAPAIRDADRRPLPDLMVNLRDLVARVRGGMLRGSELSDPTMTLTSLGERGVDSLTGVIYPPQVAIVGFGTPVTRPWVIEDRVEPRRIVHASLSADHRVSDGHRGAMFLAEVDRLLQVPETL